MSACSLPNIPQCAGIHCRTALLVVATCCRALVRFGSLWLWYACRTERASERNTTCLQSWSEAWTMEAAWMRASVSVQDGIRYPWKLIPVKLHFSAVSLKLQSQQCWCWALWTPNADQFFSPCLMVNLKSNWSFAIPSVCFPSDCSKLCSPFWQQSALLPVLELLLVLSTVWFLSEVWEVATTPVCLRGYFKTLPLASGFLGFVSPKGILLFDPTFLVTYGNWTCSIRHSPVYLHHVLMWVQQW